jgi:glucan-binding YG repeat protein
MVYYNDQIMDNLIRAKNQLPFVHVDITLLTSQGGSQISGTIGAGESRTNTNTSKSMAGVFGTITNTVTRPFAWSVSPQQTETLSIQAAPALGTQAIASTSLTMEVTKETENFDAQEKKTSTTKEKNPTPKPVTIYELYEKFARGHLSDNPVRPGDNSYVSGTLKRWGNHYYYISNNDTDKKAYYEFCKKLFTKGQAGSLETALQRTQAAAALR